MASARTALLLCLLPWSVLCVAEEATCDQPELTAAGGECLLQKGKRVSKADIGDEASPALRRLRDMMPESLLQEGLGLFEHEDALLRVASQSTVVSLTYSGVPMTLRMSSTDDAKTRMIDEGIWSSYNMESMKELRRGPSGMLNMLDVGGNYGVVSIATFKKYPELLRIITVEPIPTTYFFLRWNMHLNGVPMLDEKTLRAEPTKPGVLALNRGATSIENKDLHFCFDPQSSMNARSCECSGDNSNVKCVTVPGVSMPKLIDLFGPQEQITMLKMDCEFCETENLPALVEPGVRDKVQLLAGELHLPEQKLEDLACMFGEGKLMSKCERRSETDIACGVPLNCPATAASP